jgi:hypothetical protein
MTYRIKGFTTDGVVIEETTGKPNKWGQKPTMTMPGIGATDGFDVGDEVQLVLRKKP